MNGSAQRTLDRTPPARRGVSLMIAVVLLAITTGLLLAAARTATLHRRSLPAGRAAAQADLLADAAARLAADRPAADWSPALPDGDATVTYDPPSDGDAPDDDAAPQRGFTVFIEVDGTTARVRRAFRKLTPPDAPRSDDRTDDE